jgi:hypothetical protein
LRRARRKPDDEVNEDAGERDEHDGRMRLVQNFLNRGSMESGAGRSGGNPTSLPNS